MANFFQNLGQSLLSGVLGTGFIVGKTIADKAKLEPVPIPKDRTKPIDTQQPDKSLFETEDIDHNAYNDAIKANNGFNYNLGYFDLDNDSKILQSELDNATNFAKGTDDLFYTAKPAGNGAPTTDIIKELKAIIESNSKYKDNVDKVKDFIKVMHDNKSTANILLALTEALCGKSDDQYKEERADMQVFKDYETTSGKLSKWLKQELTTGENGELAYQLLENWLFENFDNEESHFPSGTINCPESGAKNSLDALEWAFDEKEPTPTDGLTKITPEDEKVTYEDSTAYKRDNNLYDANGKFIGKIKNNEE